MVWRCKNKGLNSYGKIYDTEVVERFVNGFKLKLKSNGDTAFVVRSDMEILEATEEELTMPIKF